MRPMLLVFDDGTVDPVVREDHDRLRTAAAEHGVRVETVTTEADTEIARYASLVLNGRYAAEYLRLGPGRRLTAHICALTPLPGGGRRDLRCDDTQAQEADVDQSWTSRSGVAWRGCVPSSPGLRRRRGPRAGDPAARPGGSGTGWSTRRVTARGSTRSPATSADAGGSAGAD